MRESCLFCSHTSTVDLLLATVANPGDRARSTHAVIVTFPSEITTPLREEMASRCRDGLYLLHGDGTTGRMLHCRSHPDAFSGSGLQAPVALISFWCWSTIGVTKGIHQPEVSLSCPEMWKASLTYCNGGFKIPDAEISAGIVDDVINEFPLFKSQISLCAHALMTFSGDNVFRNETTLCLGCSSV